MAEAIIISHQNLEKEAVCDDGFFQLKVVQNSDKAETLKFSRGSVYCFLQSGQMKLINKFISADFVQGMYASQQAPCSIELAPRSKVIIAVTERYSCLNQIGGPIESVGRLVYIDGCSDTLLISPSRLGEPCLNLLHFPSNTVQTPHHHPSFRFGIVASGEGECVSEGRVVNLNTGDSFYLPSFVEHKFNTKNHSMNIIAFHPDSDWGPTDKIHPMINRTIILNE